MRTVPGTRTGDDLGGAVPAPKVVKVRTDDGLVTELEPAFVQICSKVKENTNGPVAVILPDALKVGVEKAIEFWQESKAKYFDGAKYLASLENKDVQELIKAAFQLGYDPLVEIMVTEYRRRLAIMCQDPNFKGEYDGDPDEWIDDVLDEDS